MEAVTAELYRLVKELKITSFRVDKSIMYEQGNWITIAVGAISLNILTVACSKWKLHHALVLIWYFLFRDKSSNSLPLNSNEGNGEFQIQKDLDMGTQCLVHKGRMNFHLDYFCCHDLVVGVTVGSILHCLQTQQEETVESKQIWNSVLAFSGTKAMAGPWRKKLDLVRSMPLLKAMIPLLSTAHLLAYRGTDKLCPSSHSSPLGWPLGWPRYLLALSHAAAPLQMPVGLAGDLGEPFWLRRASSAILLPLFGEHWKTPWGSVPAVPAQSPPEGASWQTLTFALGRHKESMALLADLGWDAFHLESSWNFTTWRSDKNPHISAGLSSSSIWNLESVCWLHFKDPVEELLEMGWAWTGALPQIWQKTVAGFSRVAIRAFLLYCSISTSPLVFLLWDSNCN